MSADTSIFDGWYDDGTYRVEDCGCDVYAIYVRDGDAYVHAARVIADSAEDAIDRYYTSGK